VVGRGGAAAWLPGDGVTATLTPAQRASADRLVRAGERVLWTGAPDPAVRFTQADAWFVPFSVAWAAFSIFWEATAATSGAGVFFVLWGAMFVGVGAYLTVGRFVVKARRKCGTVYVLTDQRAVVATNGTVTEAPWQGRGRQVRWHGDGRHVTVVFDADGGAGGGRGGGPAATPSRPCTPIRAWSGWCAAAASAWGFTTCRTGRHWSPPSNDPLRGW
jgi:hypothetical protein